MSTHAIPPLVALTHDAKTPIEPALLAAVGAALQKQVTRDFAPAWGQTATIAAFPSVDAVPDGYWKIIVKRSVDDGDSYGYHSESEHQPHAYVKHTRDWPWTASHELLEMLADPWGSRLVVADDPRGRTGRVRVLVEACDPCETFSYKVDGFALSDFVLPSYYGPHRWIHTGRPPAGTAHSFTGAIASPLSLAKGGYLSFVDAKGEWWQLNWFGSRKKTTKLQRAERESRPLREWIDAQAERRGAPSRRR